jgi:hypothetical protein
MWAPVWTLSRKRRLRRVSEAIAPPSYHRPMTNMPPDLTIPGLAVVELRVRVDNINKILTELVSRIKPAGSETAGFVRIALEDGQAIVEPIGSSAQGSRRNAEQ